MDDVDAFQTALQFISEKERIKKDSNPTMFVGIKSEVRSVSKQWAEVSYYGNIIETEKCVMHGFSYLLLQQKTSNYLLTRKPWPARSRKHRPSLLSDMLITLIPPYLYSSVLCLSLVRLCFFLSTHLKKCKTYQIFGQILHNYEQGLLSLQRGL